MHRMTGTTLPRVLMLALVISAVACSKKKDDGGYIDSAASMSDTTPAVPAPLKVTEITVGKGINPDKTIKNETGDFGVRDTIYVGVKTEGASAGSKLSAKWTYQTGQAVSESSLNIAAGSADTRHEFHIQKPSVWPKGDYKVEIFLDGVSAGTKDFSVK